LEDAERKLRTLYGFMQSISSSLDASEIVERIARNLIDIYPGAESAAVHLVDSATGKIEPAKALRRDGRIVEPTVLPEQFYEEVVQKGRAVLSAPMSLSWEDQEHSKGGLAMHAPILSNDVPQGVLHVRGSQRAGYNFSQADLDLLTAIA